MIVWSENEVWKRLSSLTRSGGALLPRMHFGLKSKSLGMIDLEVTLLIHLRFFQSTFHPPPFLAAKRPFTAARVFPSIAQTVLGACGSLSAHPEGSGGAQPPNLFEDFMVWSFPPLAAKRPHLRLGGLVERLSSPSGRPDGARPPNVYGDFMV